jgi:hypothetical protein
MKSHLTAYLLGGSAHIYIGFETLKVKCTQYGICSQAAFKNARANFFCVGRDGHLFPGGFEKFPGGGRNFAAGLPPPGSDTPHTLVGGVISSAKFYLRTFILLVVTS